MSEEFVTNKILDWLKANKWHILCFDFPQSGTGVVLRQNGSLSKNKESIIPDIVAVKGDVGVLFENKSYFDYSDFLKIYSLKSSNLYSQSLKELFGTLPNSMFYGIGMPDSCKGKAKPNLNMIDFLITVNDDEVSIDYSSERIF